MRLQTQRQNSEPAAIEAFIQSQRAIDDFLDRLSMQQDDGRRLRTTQRVPLFGEVTITPIDWQGRMCGLTAEVPARWMTADGLAFVHARPVSLDRLLITMNDAPTGRFRLVASVLSTRTIGSTVEVIVRFEKKRSVPRPHFFSSFQRPTKDSQSTSSDTEKLKGH